MLKNTAIRLLVLFAPLTLISQINTPGGLTCDDAGPICSDTSGSFIFQNTFQSGVDLGNIACLGNAPDPAWFFLRVEQAGDLQFVINQWEDINGDGLNNDGPMSGIDVDFIAWGPFTDANGNCGALNFNCPTCPSNTSDPNFYPNDLDSSNIIDCSYDLVSSESFTIVNAQPLEFYIVLITNFEQQEGLIEIVQTNIGDAGAGTTDCSIINVDGILGPDQNICDGTSADLNANPNSDPTFVDFTWEYDDGTGFAPIAGTDGLSMISVRDAGEYQVTITNSTGDSDTDIVEVVVTPIPIVNPVLPQDACDDDNDGFFDFNFSTLTATVTGTQTDVEVSYHNLLSDAQMDMSPIVGLYENAVANTVETIFIRVESTINRTCFATGQFDINVFDTPIANTVDPQLICDDNNDGFWEFNLDALRTTVFGSQSDTDNTVTFHPTSGDAIVGSSPLPNLYTNQMAYEQETIFVRIENNANPDCFSTTDFITDVFDQPVANTVLPQRVCDDNNDGFWPFDLNTLEQDVLGSQLDTQFNVTFHRSLGDAMNDSGALTSPYTNQVAYDEETIFVRIENVDNEDCYETSDFTIQVFQQPILSPDVYELCDDATDGDDTNGFVEFNLISRDDDILNGQDPTQFTVTYYETQAEADAMMPAIDKTAPYLNATANNDQVIARVTNNDNTNCYATTTLDLVVNPLPVLISYMVELKQCDDDTDGFADFNLAQAESLLSTNAVNETFTYHLTQAQAESGMGSIPNPTSYTNLDPSTNPDTLFVRIETNNGCHRVAQLDLLVATTAIPNGLEILYETCDIGNVDNDIANGVETFDFSDAEALIRAQVMFPVGQNLIFSYYETRDDAEAEINAIPDISNHRNDASPFEQEIYVRVDGNIENDCIGLGVHVRLRTINPEPNTNPDDIVLCDDVTVGDLVEEFDLTENEAFILNSIPNVEASYFLDYNDALNNVTANEITAPETYNNTNPNETIYVRVEDTVSGCIAIVDFDITVNPLPNDDIVLDDIFECENNTDFVFEFDLESKTDEILNIQDDPSNYTVTYHDSQQDADNLTDPLSSPFSNTISPTQTIFVAITNNTTACSISTLTFNVDVQEGAEAADILYEECDVVGDNDGFTQFNLESIEDRVLDGQDSNAFSINFFDNFDDAFNNNLSERLPLLYENLTVNTQVIYARVSNNIRPEECFAVSEVTLQVNLLPIFSLEDDYILCLTSTDEAAVPVPPELETGLSELEYSFEWSLDGTVLPAQTASSLIPIQGGTYMVEVTNTSTGCSDTDVTEVIESGLPDTFDVNITSQAFTGNNMIIATASGNSTYEFSLDNGPWELFGEFNNVTGGTHTVAVRDVNGCGIITRDIVVIDYPKFFTPNGDGNNDTWNIKGIFTQPTASIYIFDRYGKLLKQLSPTSPGWDGTFNGNAMPSSDYWFTLEYIEELTGEPKTLSAHFALKR